MKNMTPRLVANACSGILYLPEGAPELEHREIDLVTTDSREAGEGSLFAAVRGERADGHDFVGKAALQGAICLLVERDLTENDFPDGGADRCAWIRVLSVRAALRDLAGYYLEQLDIPAVGIAGSVGKTSTKEMVAAVLAQKYRVLKTQGNFNNELGVPLTIFRLRDEDEIAVIEMGISDFGEMHRLSAIVRPDTVVMTNIGECHLEFLGDRDGVLRAKSEIFDFLKPEGHIILNGNDDKLVSLQLVNGIRPVFFGLPDCVPEAAVKDADTCAGADTGSGREEFLSFWADEIENRSLKGTACQIHMPGGSFRCVIPIPGRHMVMNALAGAAAGMCYGLSPEQIRAGIESLQPVSGRFHIIDTGRITVVDDCYNANPVSMKASLDVLRDAGSRKVAVLGDMAELGSTEEALHEEVGEHAADCGIDRLITIGPRGKWIGQGTAGRISMTHYEDTETFLAHMDEEIADGDTVLVKASHCMGFERIVNALEQSFRTSEE